MPPALVSCRCCACGCVVMAVCSVCEARHLEAVLAKRGVVAREHPSTDAWDALVASYHCEAHQ